MKAVDVVAYVGITYRQLDHWCRLGIIQPLDKANPGSGTSREFPIEEVEKIAVIARLVRVGFGLNEARRIAQLREKNVFLGEGITIHIDGVGSGAGNHSAGAAQGKQV